MIDYGKRINNVGMFGKTGAGHLVIDDKRGFDGEGLKPYSPRNIFYGYKAGVFLNFSDANRYQDAAGTTLATVDTNPLGLSYDLKNGVPVLGAPLTLLATTAAKTTDGTTTVNLLATSSVVGKAVRVQFTVASITGSFTVSSTGTSGTSVTVSATGSYDIVVMAGATGGNIQIEGLTTSRFDVTDIVIRELPGNHAYQVTTTARPLLASSPSRAVFDNVDDQLNVYFSGGLTDATIVREYTGIGYQYDAGRTMLPNHIINTDFSRYIVRQGSLTAAEQAALEAYLGNSRKFMILKSADTTIDNIRIYTGGASTDVLFIGANGATVTKTLSLNAYSGYNVSSDGLTAPVVVIFPQSLINNTALQAFSCHVNQLTGSIPSLTTNTALKEFTCYNNQLTGSIPNLTNNTALQVFHCHTNQLTGWDGGTVPATLGEFRAQNNLLPQSVVDGLLAAFVAAGKAAGTRVLYLGGAGNAAPSAAGLADKAILQSRGWIVTTN